MKKLNVILSILLLTSCHQENNSSNKFIESNESLISIENSISEINQTDFYSLQGYVKDENNNGISNVTISLYDVSDKLYFETKSNETGYYEFNEIKEGTYYIKAIYKEVEMYEIYSSDTFEIKNDYQMPDIILRNKNIKWGELQ